MTAPETLLLMCHDKFLSFQLHVSQGQTCSSYSTAVTIACLRGDVTIVLFEPINCNIITLPLTNKLKLMFCRLQAESLHVHPLYMMIPVTIAASFAFMLPVATPPNAVVFAYGHLKIKDMVSLILSNVNDFLSL